MKPLLPPDNLDVALGILSGRIDPDTMSWEECQKLYSNTLKSGMQGGGRPITIAMRSQAESVVWDFLFELKKSNGTS